MTVMTEFSFFISYSKSQRASSAPRQPSSAGRGEWLCISELLCQSPAAGIHSLERQLSYSKTESVKSLTGHTHTALPEKLLAPSAKRKRRQG